MFLHGNLLLIKCKYLIWRQWPWKLHPWDLSIIWMLHTTSPFVLWNTLCETGRHLPGHFLPWYHPWIEQAIIQWEGLVSNNNILAHTGGHDTLQLYRAVLQADINTGWQHCNSRTRGGILLWNIYSLVTSYSRLTCVHWSPKGISWPF